MRVAVPRVGAAARVDWEARGAFLAVAAAAVARADLVMGAEEADAEEATAVATAATVAGEADLAATAVRVVMAAAAAAAADEAAVVEGLEDRVEQAVHLGGEGRQGGLAVPVEQTAQDTLAVAAAAAVWAVADWAVDWAVADWAVVSAEVSALLLGDMGAVKAAAEGHNLVGRAAVMAEERALSPEGGEEKRWVYQCWVHPQPHMHYTIRRQASELTSAAR